MNNEVTPDLVRSEAEKRARHVDSAQQWNAFLELCEWLDSQQPVPRNSKAGCLAAQAKREENARKYPQLRDPFAQPEDR
jgi:hypothetical protein